MVEPEIVVEKGAHTFPVLVKRRQLLVADDDKTVRELLSRILSSLGYEVTLAENGLEAGTLFVTGSYDLVITDLQMPLMNGCDLSRLVKERSPQTPVIMVTGFCEDKQWEKVDMGRIDAIFMKPFNLKEMDKTVQRLLNSGTY